MRGGTDSELSVLCSSHSNTQKPATDQSSYGVPSFQSCALLLGASSAASAYSTGCIHWAKLCLTIILANGRHFQMGSVHKHLVQFPMPDFNCSFTGEGVKIKTSIPAVKSPRTHSSQSSTECQLKMVPRESCTGWISFPVTAAFKSSSGFQQLPSTKSVSQEPVRTLAQTLSSARMKLIHLFLFLQNDQI